MDSLNFEVGKNCILSGLKLKIIDEEIITENDFSQNLFIETQDIGQKRAFITQKILAGMNSLTTVEIISEIQPSQVLCYSGPIKTAVEVNNSCRSLSISSYFLFKSENTILVLCDLFTLPSKTQLSLLKILETIPSFLQKPKKKFFPILYSFLSVLYSEYFDISVDQSPKPFFDDNLYRESFLEIKSKL